MARGIENCVLFSWRVNDRPTDLYGLSFGFLFIRAVHDVGQPPGVTALVLGFLLELFDGALVDYAHRVDQVTANGRLSGVDVTDEDETSGLASLVNIADVL